MRATTRHSADLAEQRGVDRLGFRLFRLAIEPGLGQDELRIARNNVIKAALIGWNVCLVMARRGLFERKRAGRSSLRFDYNVRRSCAVQNLSRGIVFIGQNVIVHNRVALLTSRPNTRTNGAVTMRDVAHHLRPQSAERFPAYPG